MGEYLKQSSDNKQNNKIENNKIENERKRIEYFMKKDIESIKKAVLIAFYNNEYRFQCKRHCNEEYIEYIKKSLEMHFIDSTIYYTYNNIDDSYILHIEWG